MDDLLFFSHHCYFPPSTEQAKRLEGLLEDFNPLVWVVAVVIVMVVTNVLGGLLLLAYYFQHKIKKSGKRKLYNSQ